MLGMMFTEFMEMVERDFGPDRLDDVLEEAGTRDDGAFTAVGDYDHEELVRMVLALSRQTDRAVPDLLRAFGHHLMPTLSGRHPEFFDEAGCAFRVFENLDRVIHREVAKIYPRAVPPRISAERLGDGAMRLHYRSERAMGDLALGLIEGCCRHFGESVEIDREATGDGEVFVVRRAGPR